MSGSGILAAGLLPGNSVSGIGRAPARAALLGAALLGAALVSAGPARAGSLTYQPTNPSFGGSPLNGSWLLGQATSQNIYTRLKQQSASMAQAILQAQQTQTATSQANTFASIINARLLASVADRITNAIFGDNAQQSGTFVVQGTTISFQQIGANVQITVNDGASVSTVTVPTGF